MPTHSPGRTSGGEENDDIAEQLDVCAESIALVVGKLGLRWVKLQSGRDTWMSDIKAVYLVVVLSLLVLGEKVDGELGFSASHGRSCGGDGEGGGGRDGIDEQK